MSKIKDYFKSLEYSTDYSSTELVEYQDGILYIEIYVRNINTLISRITYVLSEDKLYITDMLERKTSIIKNFSTINSEEKHFQQMTVQDLSEFDFDDVEPFMKHIERILKS